MAIGIILLMVFGGLIGYLIGYAIARKKFYKPTKTSAKTGSTRTGSKPGTVKKRK